MLIISVVHNEATHDLTILFNQKDEQDWVERFIATRKASDKKQAQASTLFDGGLLYVLQEYNPKVISSYNSIAVSIPNVPDLSIDVLRDILESLEDKFGRLKDVDIQINKIRIDTNLQNDTKAAKAKSTKNRNRG